MKIIIKDGWLREGMIAGELKKLLELTLLIRNYEMDIPDEVINSLSPREKKVFEARYNEGKLLEVIGKELNVTRERVRQIGFIALKKVNVLTRERAVQPSNQEAKGQQRMMYLVNFVPDRGLFDPSSQAFVDEIQSAPTRAWRRDFGNVWLIVTSENTPSLVYQRLRPHMLDKDRLLIMSMNSQTQYQGWLPSDAWDWLSTQIQSGVG